MGNARGIDLPGGERYDSGGGGLRDTGSSLSDPTWVGSRKRAGRPRRYPEPKLGARYGKLTVVGLLRGPRGGLAGVMVACECGRKPYRKADGKLRHKTFQACRSCRIRQKNLERGHLHADICPDKARSVWLRQRIANCKARCHNPRHQSYANYGGRGIFVHPEWRPKRAGTRAFLAYLLTLPGSDDPTLEMDRIDNEKGYEPGNIRFITQRANCNNRRSLRAMQQRVDELEARLRHCECRAAKPVHRPLKHGAARRS